MKSSSCSVFVLFPWCKLRDILNDPFIYQASGKNNNSSCHFYNGNKKCFWNSVIFLSTEEWICPFKRIFGNRLWPWPPNTFLVNYRYISNTCNRHDLFLLFLLLWAISKYLEPVRFDFQLVIQRAFCYRSWDSHFGCSWWALGCGISRSSFFSHYWSYARFIDSDFSFTNHMFISTDDS